MLKKIIENTIFVCLLIILGIVLSPVLPFKNIPRTYIVVSGSMEPTIKTGSIVLTTPVNPTEVKINDVVAFTSPSNSKDVILHRVIAVKSTSPLRFQTKGDNNNAPDAWDLMDVGVLGKQVYAVPYLGHIAAFVRQPLGFSLIIVFPALVFIISQVLNIKKYIKQEIDRQVKLKALPVLIFFLSFVLASSSVFTVSVVANFVAGTSVSQVVFSIKDFVAPPTPSLVSPTNNSFRNTNGLVMDWTDVADYKSQHQPVYYIYQSAYDPLFSNIAYTSGKLSASFIPAPGTSDGIYYWHVKACDSVDNCSPWSNYWKVTVDNISPSIPNLISPYDGSVNNGQRLTQVWSASVDQSGNPVKYEYESCHVDPGLGACPKIRWSEIFSTTSKTATNVADATFWWRVRSIDLTGNKSGWSSVWKLIVDNPSPATSLNLGQAELQTTHNFDIGYTAADFNFDYAELCYSYNYGNYVCGYRKYLLTGSFNFDSPRGDGVYDFYAIGHDLAGNVEDVKLSPELTVQVDTITPTTNLDNSSITAPHTNGQNLLSNGSFELGSVGWVSTGTGDHHVVSQGENTIGETFPSVSGNNMFILGNKDTVQGNITDSLFRTFVIPQKLSSSLSFSYRSISRDAADNDQFHVEIRTPTNIILESILNTGNMEIGGNRFDYDSNWRSLSHSLSDYSGQTVQVWFSQVNTDVVTTAKSWTYLDDICLNTLDLRVGETIPFALDTHDTGSGLATTAPSITVNVGDTTVTYGNTDIAGNSEATQSASVIILPPVVLNKINANNSVEIYNNSGSSINLAGYKINTLDIGPTSLNSHESLIITGVGPSQTYTLNNGAIAADVSPKIAAGENWQRTPVGIGTWNKIAATLDFNLVSRPTVNKITLSVFNIGTGDTGLDYEIKYTNSVGEQGFGGTLTPESIVNGKTDRDFFLGTCSTGGACTPETVSVGSTISVNLHGTTKYFIY